MDLHTLASLQSLSPEQPSFRTQTPPRHMLIPEGHSLSEVHLGTHLSLAHTWFSRQSRMLEQRAVKGKKQKMKKKRGQVSLERPQIKVQMVIPILRLTRLYL